MCYQLLFFCDLTVTVILKFILKNPSFCVYRVLETPLLLSDSRLHLFLQSQLSIAKMDACAQGQTHYTVAQAMHRCPCDMRFPIEEQGHEEDIKTFWDSDCDRCVCVCVFYVQYLYIIIIKYVFIFTKSCCCKLHLILAYINMLLYNSLLVYLYSTTSSGLGHSVGPSTPVEDDSAHDESLAHEFQTTISEAELFSSLSTSPSNQQHVHS